MGGGSYSFVGRASRSAEKNYSTASGTSISVHFEQKTKGRIHEIFDPKGVVIRESRDSDGHPNSYAIIIALDVTGSMGEIPALLLRDGLPHIIQKIFEAGIPDPQVAFVAIGDHECDKYPLQIGQFESSDEKLDDSLTKVYPEGGGGGNAGESYLLAWYHAAFHTDIDCFNKRNQKGLLITIGDEPCLETLPANVIKGLYGTSEARDWTAKKLFEAACEKYDVYHINVNSTRAGSMNYNPTKWKSIVGERYIDTNMEGIPGIIAGLAHQNYSQERKVVLTDVPTNPGTTESTFIM